MDDVDEDDDVFVTDSAAPTVPSVVAQSKRRTRSLNALKEDVKSPKKVVHKALYSASYIADAQIM